MEQNKLEGESKDGMGNFSPTNSISNANPSASPHPSGNLFPGGGQMGKMMREYDWDAHPLGNPRHWPQSLVTAIRMMLSSGFPMFIWWSSELYMFHNDAYLPSLGKKPHAPGGKAREVWYDVMGQLGILLILS